MNHGSLCSGIGGFDLAANRLRWNNIFHCEIDPFCNAVLRYYWPSTAHHENIFNFNGKPYNGILDVLSAGFPCQPFSLSGRRKGSQDPRHLFPQVLRILRQARPRWAVFENVAGLFTILEPESLSELEHQEIKLFCKNGEPQANTIVTRIQRRVLGRIIEEIVAAGYILPRLQDGTPVVLCIPACAVGAIHRRDRVWIVAHADSIGLQGEHSANIAKKERCRRADTFRQSPLRIAGQDWPDESPFCSRDDAFSRQLHGITFSQWRTGSIKAFGNAIVPDIAEELFRCIDIADTAIEPMDNLFQPFSSIF